MQLLDSDWPANILAGSHFRAQETRALSPDGVCALARARLSTRLGGTVVRNTALQAGGLWFKCPFRQVFFFFVFYTFWCHIFSLKW